MNSADHRGVAALNELETNEQTGHSCAPEVAGALNVGLEGQRKDTAGVSHLSVAPQPVQTAEDERAAFEAEMRCEETWGHKNLRRNKFGHYVNPWTSAMWDAWQARAALASKPVPQCIDQFCACHGGPVVSCAEGEREKELAGLKSSVEFYKRRCDLLQEWQSKMRDPERMIVCDVLANGQTLPESTGRYALAAQPVREPMSVNVKAVLHDALLALSFCGKSAQAKALNAQAVRRINALLEKL